jgi:hypothetical protein
MRLVRFCVTSMLSLAAGTGLAHAYDMRIDPKAASRAEFTIDFTHGYRPGSYANSPAMVAQADVNVRRYASAMALYRVALADGYTQAPMVAVPWPYDEQLPEPLHWAWIADSGDVIARTGKGHFQMSFGSNQSSLFRQVDCSLLAWPEGNSEAPMKCSDGTQRTMQIPGDGIVIVDAVRYARVFNSEQTTLPPPQDIPVDDVTPEEAAALQQVEQQQQSSDLPDKAPIPLLR